MLTQRNKHCARMRSGYDDSQDMLADSGYVAALCCHAGTVTVNGAVTSKCFKCAAPLEAGGCTCNNFCDCIPAARVVPNPALVEQTRMPFGKMQYAMYQANP